jgi:hypothetical protein
MQEHTGICKNVDEVRSFIEQNQTRFHVKLSFEAGGDIAKNPKLIVDQIRSLAGLLGNNTSITSLDLSGNNLDKDAAGCIAWLLSQNTPLQNLNLSNNCLGFEGAKVLFKALESNEKLKRFNISQNNIGEYKNPKGKYKELTKKQAAELFANNISLHELDISENNLTSSSAPALAQLTCVRRLDMGAMKKKAVNKFANEFTGELLNHVPTCLTQLNVSIKNKDNDFFTKLLEPNIAFAKGLQTMLVLPENLAYLRSVTEHMLIKFINKKITEEITNRFILPYANKTLTLKDMMICISVNKACRGSISKQIMEEHGKAEKLWVSKTKELRQEHINTAAKVIL